MMHHQFKVGDMVMVKHGIVDLPAKLMKIDNNSGLVLAQIGSPELRDPQPFAFKDISPMPADWVPPSELNQGNV